MKRSPTGIGNRKLELTRHATAAARSPNDLIADRLRHSLLLAVRCLEELRSLGPELRSEVRERLDHCWSLVNPQRARGRR